MKVKDLFPDEKERGIYFPEMTDEEINDDIELNLKTKPPNFSIKFFRKLNDHDCENGSIIETQKWISENATVVPYYFLTKFFNIPTIPKSNLLVYVRKSPVGFDTLLDFLNSIKDDDIIRITFFGHSLPYETIKCCDKINLPFNEIIDLVQPISVTNNKDEHDHTYVYTIQGSRKTSWGCFFSSLNYSGNPINQLKEVNNIYISSYNKFKMCVKDF